MNTAAQFFKILIRMCGGGALILGLAFWLGYGRSLHWGSNLAGAIGSRSIQSTAPA